MKRSIDSVYLMNSLKGPTGALIGVFIPIYFLTLHYSVAQVFIYYIVYALFVLILFTGASALARRIGLKRTLFAYLPFQFLYLWLLYILPAAHEPLWTIAAASAASISLYWYALHMFFLTNAEKERLGASVGKLYAFPKLIVVGAPFIGAAIATYFGFPALFFISAILYVISSIPMLSIPDMHPQIRFRSSRFIGLVRGYPRYILAEFGENIREELEGVVLPIFVFVTFGSILSVGIIGSIVGIGSALFILIIGAESDRLKRNYILRIGAVIIMMNWLAFSFVQGEISFYVLALLEGFLGTLLLIPFNAVVYTYAKQNDAPAEFIVFREIPVTLARVFVYGVGIALVGELNYLFLLPVFGSLLFWLL